MLEELSKKINNLKIIFDIDNKIEEMLRQDFENTIANKLELFDDKDDAYKHIIDIHF